MEAAPSCCLSDHPVPCMAVLLLLLLLLLLLALSVSAAICLRCVVLELSLCRPEPLRRLPSKVAALFIAWWRDTYSVLMLPNRM